VREVIATIDAAELERRKAWVELGVDDLEQLRSLAAALATDRDEIVEQLVEHFREDPETAGAFTSEADLERFRALQREYLDLVAAGDLERDYAVNRVEIGALHQRMGIDPKWYVGGCSFRLRHLVARLPAPDPAAWQAVEKLIFLDLSLVLDTYLAVRERTIRDQQDAIREMTLRQQRDMIRELSTPVLQIRQGLLMLPIVGSIDSQRAQMLTQAVLEAIRDRRSRVVVLDITGVPAVDSAVANHLVQTVDACRLMGASVVLTGLSPEVAQTLVTLGIDLSTMITVGDLEGGLAAADRLLGSPPGHHLATPEG